MSWFTTERINEISPYKPGEQPRERKYIKLNTNENPYFVSKFAVESVNRDLVERLNRYSDPESRLLTREIARYYGVDYENVLVTNGSDEALAFAFLAYGSRGVSYPDVTYGFYDVIANLFGCPVEHIALDGNFKVIAADYFNKNNTIVLANPNAQTGIELPQSELEQIIINNPDRVVIIDQAYADFGEGNAINLIGKYENLLVINTFSKSRSLAGARVGYAIGNAELIGDLKKIKNSFHPYNVNSLSAALAVEAIKDESYFLSTVDKIKNCRNYLSTRLKELGFTVLPSSTNFVLAKSAALDGETLYLKLKGKGVLVRYFADERIRDYVRITVGTNDEIEGLLATINDILAEI